MASYGNLSDAEISKKLKEIGITIPVTSSTRGILIKKLENNLSGKSTSPTPRVTKTRKSYSLSQYSSGDESDNDKHGRSIAAKNMPPPPAVKTRNTRRQTFASPPSYSEPKVVEPPAKTTRGRFSMSTTTVRNSPLISPSRVSYDENGSDSDTVESPNTSNHSTRLSDLNGSDSHVSNLLSYRKQPTPKPASPFLSDFTRRLAEKANRESRKVGSLIPQTSKLFKEKDTDEFDDFIARHSRLNSPSTARDNGTPGTSDLSQQFKTEEAPRLFSNSQAISMVLLLFACIFFLVLGVAYLNIRDNQPVLFTSENIQNTYPTCAPDMIGDNYNSDLCIPPELLLPATKLMRHLHPELVRRAVQAQCGPAEHDGSFVSPLMTEKQLVQWLSRKTNLEDWQSIRDLRNLKKILLSNPHWNIQVVSATPTPATADERGLEDNHILVGNGGLQAIHVDLPWTCLARLKLVSAASTLVLIIVGAFAVYGGKLLWSWRSNRQKRGRQEVFSLVQRILSVLQSHHASLPAPGSPGSSTGHGCLAINHVRDQLIAPQDRDGMASVWQQAVDFLERNESRVRAEVQEVAGEDCPVWRWLPPASPPSTPNISPSCGSLPGHDPHRAKLWQGQAFVTEPGAQNGAPSSPTPCLKLRHMFDQGESGEGWRDKVTDALLEKCGEGVNVLHIAFEPRSPEGLVYIKCATLEDAGIAYRAVHGWWFDSKLVTVKYIRLERYHERFPDARDATAPLKPSNNKKLSLSNSFWQLPLDGN